jgi:hypothetical protein
VKAPQIRGIPFDYFARRDCKAYIIVFRDPLNRMSEPADVLRGRITSLVHCIEGIEALLIQVSLKGSYYRVMQTRHLEPTNKDWVKRWSQDCSLPVVEWIKERITKP